MDDYGRALADGIDAALPDWVTGHVTRLMIAWAGEVPLEVAAAARAAGIEARSEIGGAVRALLELDVDDQRSTPLAILRTAVRYPGAVLRQAGVPPVQRDRFAEEAFPGDDYDLTPASFADLDPALRDVGLAWGAAKAMQHRRRHQT